jgi:N-acyl-D-amino-acid deacylase
MEELVIRDADVVDGSGADSYRADVVVDGGRIVSIVKEALFSRSYGEVTSSSL